VREDGNNTREFLGVVAVIVDFWVMALTNVSQILAVSIFRHRQHILPED
jgi:hypothetical protein